MLPLLKLILFNCRCLDQVLVVPSGLPSRVCSCSSQEALHFRAKDLEDSSKDPWLTSKRQLATLECPMGEGDGVAGGGEGEAAVAGLAKKSLARLLKPSLPADLTVQSALTYFQPIVACCTIWFHNWGDQCPEGLVAIMVGSSDIHHNKLKSEVQWGCEAISWRVTLKNMLINIMFYF